MKKSLLCLSLLAMLGLWSCNDKKSNTTITPTTPVGRWKVVRMIDDLRDLTQQFRNMEFEIRDDETMLVFQNGTLVNSGRWKLRGDTSRIGEREMGIDVNDSRLPFDHLDSWWDIVSISATQVRLRDDDGDDDEILWFERL